jgi:predicted polyphosphate/ATP-dependent NAD kinase
MAKHILGLIVNPVAGLGGRVGLKGSDGAAIQQKALALGAVPHAGERAAQALQVLLPLQPDLEILTYPGEMGAEAARQVGFEPHVLGAIRTGHTTAADTIRAAKEMLQNSVALLLFAGGDGTARDVCVAIELELPALGIPAGVKIHSAVYATHPRAAGELAVTYLRGEANLREAEVMDIDEDAFRAGRLSPRLYGYLKTPYLQRYVQGVKAPSQLSESAALEAIAEDLSERMKSDWLYIFGPGSTTHAIAKHLGLEKTLLGVDAVLDGKIVAADTNEADLLRLLEDDQPAEIIVTPIGGQGCIFGRGNQPISPAVIRKAGRAHIRVVSSPEKIQALDGAPLWADTGDRAVDEMLSGYMAVITGYKESVMYKVTA